ncbi:MAG: putative sulfate/molybdate transporter [Myxococcota bacterium]|nr:putative sulfate/molybdate transporter [Myxococcota bacterium]
MSSPHNVPRVRFDRHELAGAFGDIGTDVPLLIALVATCGLDAASVCIVFGALQIATGLLYGIPMPVQPLKAMAAIMLAQRLSPGILAGGGLVIGGAMLLLAATGALGWLARVIPREVVRGIQLGLGLTLATLALREYVGADGPAGYLLAGVAVFALLALGRQRRIPAPLVVMGLGVLYGFVRRHEDGSLLPSVGLRLPGVRVPTWEELMQGALLLALPQLPLSISNSVIATSQTVRDLFPARAVSVRQIGLTYGLMNLVAPWFGGVPVCHGCGGLAGFHALGARTGGAPILYGAMYLLLGLVLAPGFTQLVRVVPMPVLGVVLLVEAVALMMLVRDMAADQGALWVALVVAAAVVGLPWGYVVGLVVGTLLSLALRRGWMKVPAVEVAEPSQGPRCGTEHDAGGI